MLLVGRINVYGKIILFLIFFPDLMITKIFLLFQTDLAHHNPFTVALKNLGNKISDKEKSIFFQLISLTLSWVYCLVLILKYPTNLLFKINRCYCWNSQGYKTVNSFTARKGVPGLDFRNASSVWWRRWFWWGSAGYYCQSSKQKSTRDFLRW